MKDQEFKGKFTSAKKVFSILCLTLFVSWAFILWHHNYQRQKLDLLLVQFQSVKKEQRQLLKSFDATLFTLDSLSGKVYADEKYLIDRNGEIITLKRQIERLLHNESANTQDNQKTERLIERLNSQINSLSEQIRDLRSNNQLLTQQRDTIAGEKEEYKRLKEELETQVRQLALKTQEASTLVTDTLHIQALRSRKGGVDRVVKNSRKGDKFLLSFDVYNRIIEAGQTNICITILDPEGNVVRTSDVTFSGDSTDKQFTVMLPVNIQPGVQTKIQYQWAKTKNFKKGSYLIAVYHNGFKIAETMMHLS
jgi:hypothetical protein